MGFQIRPAGWRALQIAEHADYLIADCYAPAILQRPRGEVLRPFGCTEKIVMVVWPCTCGDRVDSDLNYYRLQVAA